MRLEDIKIGYCASFDRIVTDQDMADFAKLSGDTNPLHTDEAYAKKTKFNQRVVYGMLAASFFSCLVGMHTPGENALYLSQDLKFLHPIFIGEELMVQGKVIEKHESVRIITIRTQIIKKENNVIAVDGLAKVVVR